VLNAKAMYNKLCEVLLQVCMSHAGKSDPKTAHNSEGQMDLNEKTSKLEPPDNSHLQEYGEAEAGTSKGENKGN
jgi:hypothetical protein